MAGDGVIIIKRRKSGQGHGHHGGAWKVAYADFVTAMMAFFLLMWLLNATTEEQRKGLAEYFDPRIPVARVSGGGTSPFGGDDMRSEQTMAQNGAGASAQSPTRDLQARGESGAASDGRARTEGAERALQALDERLRGRSGESEAEDILLRHVRTRVTDEGLVIELLDAPGRPLFGPGSARPTPRMETLLRIVGEAAALVTNRVAVAGLARSADAQADGGWELSTDRANAARRALVAAGVEPDRLARVTGRAQGAGPSGAPDDAPDPRRVEITLLRSDL
jgi:chemotaxis protein MotB